MKIVIDDFTISRESEPYFIAEISGNHNGNIKNAIDLIRISKEIGANAIKLQTYTPDTMTINCNKDDFLIKNGLWKNYNLYDLYAKAHTPWEWHTELFEEAKNNNISIFSTPFDKTSVEFLEKFDVSLYKIASFEITDVELLKIVAQTKKNVILSTGMANYDEINNAIEILEKFGSKNIILLHCISGYPTPIQEANLTTINLLEKKFAKIVGLSDHTIGTTAAIVGCTLGAKVIEKHIIMDRSIGGVDSEFSLEPHEFKRLINDCKDAYLSIGKPSYELKPSEIQNKIFRRSIYAIKEIPKGEFLTSENTRVIRPGYGLSPKHYSSLINKAKANRNIDIGTAINWDIINL